MKYEYKIEDALLRMVALYESEQDGEAPMEKPYWLRRALDAIHEKYHGEVQIVRCPYCQTRLLPEDAPCCAASKSGMPK